MFTKLNQLRRREEGFTLIELLIVVAIIGIIAAILIPNLLDAINKARQRRSVSDMRTMGTAWMSWLNDAVSATAAGAAARQWDPDGEVSELLSWEQFRELMNPTDSPHYYLQEPPQLDGFGNEYEWYVNSTIGFDLNDAASWRNMIRANSVMAIYALMRDATNNNAQPPGPIEIYPFPVTDYDCNILWADGFFVRWPEGLAPGKKVQTQECPPS